MVWNIAIYLLNYENCNEKSNLAKEKLQYISKLNLLQLIWKI